MTDTCTGRDSRPRASPLFQEITDLNVEGFHAFSIAKFCCSDKQYFASYLRDPRGMAAKSINEVIADALRYYMNEGGWNQSTLGARANVAANTIGNALKPSRRAPSASGKEPSIKVTELSQIALVLGTTVADLVTDMTEDQRALSLRERAADYYRAHGELPSWAPPPPSEEGKQEPLRGKRAANGQ